MIGAWLSPRLRCVRRRPNLNTPSSEGGNHPGGLLEQAVAVEEAIDTAAANQLMNNVPQALQQLAQPAQGVLCGAGYRERSDERSNQRNGYRHRDFDTRAATIDVAIRAGDDAERSDEEERRR